MIRLRGTEVKRDERRERHGKVGSGASLGTIGIVKAAFRFPSGSGSN